MPSPKRSRFVLLLLALALCVWLPGRPGAPSPAGVSRQQAIRAAYFENAAPPALLAGTSAAPTLVDLADVVAGSGGYVGQDERWRRGEIDVEEHESIVSEAELAALRELALALPPGDRVQTPGRAPAPAAPVPGTGFAALDIDDCCGPLYNTVPPDPELAAGPQDLLVAVNVSFAVYKKSGERAHGPILFSDLFTALGAGTNCSSTNPFDPNVLYDESADRFIMGFDGGGRSYCMAVSKSSDPTAKWWLYEFPTNVGGYFFDFPQAGVGRDAIYVGANLFDQELFVEGRVWAFDKNALYAGQTAAFRSQSLGEDSTPQPIKLHGYAYGDWPASGPHYILTHRNYDLSIYALHAWNNPFGSNTVQEKAVFNLEEVHNVPVGLPIGSKQKGGASFTGNDHRPLDFEYGDGSGWTAMTVSCNPGEGTVNCIQWAEIDLAPGTVVQSSVFASNGTYRSFPDVAANRCGGAAFGYTYSDANSYPGVRVTGRRQGNQLGWLQNEVELKGGETTYVTAHDRWGDYTAMTIDPNGYTFWYLGEYSKNMSNDYANWGTYVGSLTLQDCRPPVPAASQVFLPVAIRPEPVAPPPPPPPSSALENGDFEQGSGVAWEELSSNGWPLILHINDLPESVATHGGEWAVWLGGDLEEESTITQQVTVPAGSSTLRFWHWISSEDTCGYDFGRVLIGNNVVSEIDLCAANNSTGWVPFSVDLSTYAGQTVTLRLQADTDSLQNSSLFLDDVSLGSAALNAPPAGAPAAAPLPGKGAVLGSPD